ncbi:MAG: universal stress protein [Halanaerobiales bacterium]|nr:universal stress protein [Halanaerobiales bacterium]
MISKDKSGKWTGYNKMLLPLGHKADINNLTNLVSYLIEKKSGIVELIHVMKEGNYSGIPREWREGGDRVTESHHMMMRKGIHSRRKMTTNKSIARGILEEAYDLDADAILLGWGPKPKSKISKMASHIMNNSHCDVIIYKNRVDIKNTKKILYPIAFEPDNSRLNLISRIIQDTNATLTIGHVIDKYKGDENKGEHLLEDAVKKAEKFDIDANKLLLKGSPVEDVIGETSEDFDLLIIGPSGDWWLYQTLFGRKTDKIASKTKCSVLLHKYKQEPDEEE